MNSYNVIGRVTRDVELRSTQDGKQVAGFGIAIDGASTERDDQGRPKAAFMDVSVWGKQAENCKAYLVKGQQCAVTGRLQFRSYEARDGQTRQKWELVANDVRFLQKPKNAEEGGGYQQAAPQQQYQQQQAPPQQHYQQQQPQSAWGSPPPQQGWAQGDIPF